MTDAQGTDLEARVAALEQRLERYEARPGGEAAYWALLRNLFPAETRKHLKAAGREQLLAARAYLDNWIARMDEPEEQPPEPRETITLE